MSSYSKDKGLIEHYLAGFAEYNFMQIGTSNVPVDVYNRFEPEIDVWQTREFFNQIIGDEGFIEKGAWAGIVICPDPYKYYQHNLGIYPIITSNTICTADEYLYAISSDPGGSEADAISYRAEIIIFSSFYGSSLYYSDEINDVALGFKSRIYRPFIY